PPEPLRSSREHVAHQSAATLSPIQLNHVEAYAIPRPHKSDHLDVEVGLRLRQRQCEEELAKGGDRDVRFRFAGQMQTLAIDDGGVQYTSVRRRPQIA